MYKSIWNRSDAPRELIFSFRCERNYMGRKIKWHKCGNAGVIFKIHVAHRRRSCRMEFYFIDAHTALAADCLRCHMVPLLTWNANEPFVASKKRPLWRLAIIFRAKLHRQMPSSFKSWFVTAPGNWTREGLPSVSGKLRDEFEREEYIYVLSFEFKNACRTLSSRRAVLLRFTFIDPTISSFYYFYRKEIQFPSLLNP